MSLITTSSFIHARKFMQKSPRLGLLMDLGKIILKNYDYPQGITDYGIRCIYSLKDCI
jgi:hypothetical protein